MQEKFAHKNKIVLTLYNPFSTHPHLLIEALSSASMVTPLDICIELIGLEGSRTSLLDSLMILFGIVDGIEVCSVPFKSQIVLDVFCHISVLVCTLDFFVNTLDNWVHFFKDYLPPFFLSLFYVHVIYFYFFRMILFVNTFSR